MGFDVHADDLDSYATQVGRAAEDFQHAGRYALQHGDVAVSNEGLFGLIAGAHGGVLERVSAALTKAESVLRAAQTELVKSAQYYRETDHGNAATLDATYPTSKR
ncbi:type VII secretion target [Streptomyces yaanensis]|uniref:Type VII secretion target n=1 Tax=Streptomyces yaanensis TaxID=1142239 RepID=A0ABV7S686_9ACTN|nr:type VII secretion target [Streptomyces sp. CGMCC 4.7035]WNC00104.1 type VII secretion target [Streptomyces sp. CGMCC 4.7035]